MERLLEEIRRANHLGGSLHTIEPDYWYMGYAVRGGQRVGFVFVPRIAGKDVITLLGLKRLCADEAVLIVLNPASTVANVRLSSELNAQKLVLASLCDSLNCETFGLPIERLVSRLSRPQSEAPVVDRERSEVRYRGKAYRLTARQVDFLEAICGQPGVWVSGKQIGHHHGERLDKVKNRLPNPIRGLIESHTVNGYRLNLP